LVVNIKKNSNTATFSIPTTSVPFTISGYYHLFAINNLSGIPSIATVIRVNRN